MEPVTRGRKLETAGFHFNRMTSEEREVTRARNERMLFKQQHEKWKKFYYANVVGKQRSNQKIKPIHKEPT